MLLQHCCTRVNVSNYRVKTKINHAAFYKQFLWLFLFSFYLLTKKQTNSFGWNILFTSQKNKYYRCLLFLFIVVDVRASRRRDKYAPPQLVFVISIITHYVVTDKCKRACAHVYYRKAERARKPQQTWSMRSML